MVNIPDVDFSKLAGPSDIQRGGIIFRNTSGKVELVVIRNVHPSPRRNYRMPNASIDDVRLTPVKEIIGFAHTHLDDQQHVPSSQDIAAIPAGKLGVVYHPGRGTAVWFTNKGILRQGYRKVTVRKS